MEMIAIISGVAAFLLLLLYLAKGRQIKRMQRELRQIHKGGSNELLHTHGSGKEVKELTQEINLLLGELRRTQIHYRKKSHDLHQMMTNISHDLRTPLTSALGYTGMLQDEKLSGEEQRNALMIVEKRLLRMEELIDAFFEFSSVITGEQKPEKTEINLTGLLEEAVGHYYDDFNAKNRRIHLFVPSVRLQIVSNEKLLLRVFDNLIGNAYKHGEGDLWIRVEQTQELVTLRFENVWNDPHLEIDRVFDEFYTTDISRTRGHTGLGLAIAKQFVELLDGSIRAEEEHRLFSVVIRMPGMKEKVEVAFTSFRDRTA